MSAFASGSEASWNAHALEIAQTLMVCAMVIAPMLCICYWSLRCAKWLTNEEDDAAHADCEMDTLFKDRRMRRSNLASLALARPTLDEGWPL